MKIRADTPDEARVPKVGDAFTVIKVEKGFIWWKIKLQSQQNFLDVEDWLKWINERNGQKPPIGNSCYDTHKENLARVIVERLKGEK